MRKHVLVSALALGLLGAVGASAQTTPTFTTLYSFSGNDGLSPYAGLIFDASGALYGTTASGGAVDYGTVFKLTPPAIAGGPWTETVLYSFLGEGDGDIPTSGLVFDASGALYGTTLLSGGLFSGGTVFKLTPPTVTGGVWTKTVLHTFPYTFYGSDGSQPSAGLVFDASGALYGTTQFGGPIISGCPGGDGLPYEGCGTVFKLTPPGTASATWTETVLYDFTGSDGSNPLFASVISDASGALYGTTSLGGASSHGTVFSITPPATVGGSWTETVLYSFNGSDGYRPYAGLVFDPTGALYGTTVGGGSSAGTVFKLTPPATAGAPSTETALYSFTGNDGAYPYASLISDASGALYGTTYGGGANNLGTVFKLTPPATAGAPWTETVLHSFTGSDGANPLAGLISDESGGLYGTTLYGGSNNAGTVFQLTLPATFTGVPGTSTCTGQSLSAANKKYGGMAHAAASLGYSSVVAFQKGVVSYCGG